MHSSGTGCILISDSKTGTVCRLYFYTSCILAADFMAGHGISPSSQLTLVNFQVRQGYGYQQCVIHVLNSEVRCNMTLITTRCGIALFHVQCSMFTVFTFCVSSMYIVFTLCAIFKVHCVRTLCTLSEMQAVGFFVDKQANISCQNRRQKFAQNCEERHSVCVQGAAYWSCIHSKSVKSAAFALLSQKICGKVRKL